MADTKVLTVTQLNELVKMTLDSSPLLSSVYVKGEISNFIPHRTGHFYFRIKDADAVLSAVMFRGNAVKLKFLPENGMKVILHGRVQSFVRDGTYQIYADDMQPDGIGSLALAFEQLKRKLEAEGLFDQTRKKPLPKIPSKIGIVTSPTGAAVRDIINVTKRRFPFAKLYLFPALVQGSGAAPSLIEGVRFFDTRFPVDVIILGRGGGSMEDLWAFNDEILARTVAAANTPIISAVGHEVDFTICDFAADKRAATPSAAAEIAVPDTAELVRRFGNVSSKLQNLLLARIGACRERLGRCSSSRALTDPGAFLNDKQMLVMSLSHSLDLAAERRIEVKKAELARLTAVLSAISPLNVVSRGYSILRDEDGNVPRSVSSLSVGQKIKVGMKDGTVGAEITDITEEKKDGEKTNL